MDKRLQEALEEKQGSYIFPFFWQHGEGHDVLLAELQAIAQSGIQEFCVESRVHEEFCQEKWWDDFGFLLKEARKRDMKVWLLDDKRFPTGYANGILEREEYAPLRKKAVRIAAMDVAGPLQEAAVLANRFDPETEKLLAVSAYRRTPDGMACEGTPLDLTEQIQDGLLFLSLPDGVWRIFFVIQTNQGPEHYRYYIDMLNPESTRLQIEAVYQPHYDHFAEYFGTTFVGFFSDEPCFGNAMGSYEATLGKPNQCLPWREDLLKSMAEKLRLTERAAWLLLPGLWFDLGEVTAKIRYAYMDLITKLYRDNFSCLLGDWCRAHQVLYVGHVIEDMNSHMRLGQSAGHFFRSLDGQDMAGIDIVLNQYIPGILEMPHMAPIYGNRADPEFFSYALPKLAASHAALQPLKKGRAMCEIFGAFGWAEGLPMMKELADYMLCAGINYFVPHAFTPKYPDEDCPPYFYYRGHNPQYALFPLLMRYLQRMCHVLSGGDHIACAAIYYNAEAEWCGGERQLFQEIAKRLTQAQLDFDFVPFDSLKSCTPAKYRALIVPDSEILPQEVLSAFQQIAGSGLPVLFCDHYPRRSEQEQDIAVFLQETVCVSSDKLVSYLRELGAADLAVQPAAGSENAVRYLRYLHQERDGCHIYFFYNESTADCINAIVKVQQNGNYLRYDAMTNKITEQASGNQIPLSLEPRNGALIFYTDLPEEKRQSYLAANPPSSLGNGRKLELRAAVFTKENQEDEYVLYRQDVPLGNLARELPRFCGFLRYQTTFDVADPETFQWLDLGIVGETAQVWLNGCSAGAVLHAPFRFFINGLLKPGKNEMIVECITNPAYRERDPLSSYLHLPPSGLLGPVNLY